MIYLDNNATTQPTPRVVDAMLPYLRECYFNASSSTAAFTGVDQARRAAAAAVAALLNAEEAECTLFTSGATESNNWVFSSVAKSRRSGRILISDVEHGSVSEPAADLARQGRDVVGVRVDAQGRIDLDAFAAMLTTETVLVSIMAANNETGVVEPITEVGRLVRERSPAALFHTDATQAVGKMPIDLQEEWRDVDLLSFSAHKFHGPKGIGGLYVRPGVTLEPMIRGGGQERGFRSGTTNTPGLAGLAAAAREVDLSAAARMQGLRDELEDALRDGLTKIVHSAGALRLPNTSCFSIPGASAEDVAQALASEGIIVGTGSACSAGALHPPKSLLAMGVDYATARGALRVSLSSLTVPSDIAALVDALRRRLVLA